MTSPKFEAGSTLLEDTGERYIPGVGGQIFHCHAHRYRLACGLAADLDVLDLPSGEGYGSSWIAATAAQVVGVDIAEHVVKHAKRTYASQPNLAFVAGDMQDLPIADAAADLVVSFEGIEHVSDPWLAMSEIARVLRPDGALLISTPDRRSYSDKLGFVNEFHLSEMYAKEFEDLLRRHFRFFDLLGQQPFGGSLLWPLPDPADFDALDHYSADSTVHRLRPPDDAQYLVAFCRNVDRGVPLEFQRPSLFIGEPHESPGASPEPVATELGGPNDRAHDEVEELREEVALLSQRLTLIEGSRTWRLRSRAVRLLRS